ncbi:MAG: tRNA (N6-threonylcarbamoyladenosine(37)-N6)-methyltransferase TrmO [Desulfomonilaceae bacterium]|nr:tRNA (N6-threonylcarbamoyladenosine(37)-N6)-methyltransferase TrmO [Desulfomonilaceae bacterium]
MLRLLLVLGVFGLSVAVPADTMTEEFTVHTIGTVQKTGHRTTLHIRPAYRDALLGLDGFSHVIVIYWFDRNDTPEKRSILKVHPRGDTRNPLRGVFATRSPVRPNLIGLSVCRIKSIDNDGIHVDAIDAFHGTPIIDLKPFIPGNDCVPAAEVPGWVERGRK